MLQATNSNKQNKDVDLIVAEIAEFLNTEGQAFLAMKYLQMASKKNLRVAMLSHQIQVSDSKLLKQFQVQKGPF
jgi:hypothetical protein